MGKSISCLLVSYAGMPYTASCFFLDNGLADLAGILLKHGHSVKILDYNTPEIVEYVLKNNPAIKNALGNLNKKYKDRENLEMVQKEHLILQESIDRQLQFYNKVLYEYIKKEIIVRKLEYVGFKLWIGRGVETIVNIVADLRKEFPKVKFFAGGPAATLFYKYINHLEVFDAVTLGEGENVILQIAEYVSGERALEEIESIVYLKNGKMMKNDRIHDYPLDETIFPVYDQEIYPAAHERNKKIRVVTLDESRGCKNKCAFCTHSLLGGCRVKELSINALRNIINYCCETLHTKAFNLGGSCVPGKLLEEIARMNIEDHRHILYNCFSNVNDLLGCDLKTIHEGGLFSVFLGIESFHQDILTKDYNKYLNLNDAAHIIRSALKENIYTTCSFIYPAPHENEETRNFTKNTIISLLKNQPGAAAVIFYPGLMPGSRWSENPERYLIEAEDLESHFRSLVSCEIRHYLPTSYWDVYDYKLGGVSQKEAALLSDEFARELEKEGVNINVMGDTALLAEFLRKDAGSVGDRLKQIFSEMDYEGMYTFIEEANQGIMSY
ncbi:MAG: hypothetical protein WCD89_23215 [Anaerocolumna sp.]